MNVVLKTKAINLRNKGYSYSEIQQSIPVSHATLSRWLSKISISDKQKKRLKAKMRQSIFKAHIKNREKRMNKTKLIEEKAISEIKTISNEKLLLIGSAIYWAEGSKQKEHDVSQGICFSNSDPLMVKLFLQFIINILKVQKDMIDFDIYIHKNHDTVAGKIRTTSYWSSVTGFTIDKFDKIYFKKNKVSSIRKNKNETYFGLLRVKIKKSTDLNRKINGWIKGIIQQCGIV